MYPIKYIEDNRIWNLDGECFAYYELIPYNYTFLSAGDKMALYDDFRQLVAQNRDGKIHALQIGTKTSVRRIQGLGAQYIRGRLKAVGMQKLADQTDALVELIGDSQLDYRYFIGFKLTLNEDDANAQGIKHQVTSVFQDFIYSVNHKLMGDFTSVSNMEAERFAKMERLLATKISRRFKFRKLTKDDFGYIIEHLHGQADIPYEEYEYHLPTKKLEKETLVKRYDIIKPSRCLMEEDKRYMKLTNEGETTYVSYLTINTIVGEMEFPSSEIFYHQMRQFGFPVDTSVNVEIVPNKSALSTVRNKKKELKDLENHAWESSNETGRNVIDALESVDELESTLDESKESMYKLSYVVRVLAPTKEELFSRCEAVKDFYDDKNIKLVRPFGDMMGLHTEFIPASKRYMNDYVQYVTSDFLAALGFGASQLLGEHEGFYIGYDVDTGRNVYIWPPLAAQGVKGSVTNALAMSFTGSLGGGKSFANNLLVYYSVLWGARSLIIDPKAERGKWKETLPEMASEINIVNLTSEEENKGLLDPYVILKNPKDSEALALDILTFLTGISARDGDKFPVLRKAIREVTNSDQRGLLYVLDELRKDGTRAANQIADHIESFTDYDFAQLLFSRGGACNTIHLDKQMNIIQIADLVLPDSQKGADEYTTTETLSIAMLIVISTFALDFIQSERSIYKIVDLDEAWTFLQVPQGKELSKKLVRAGRAMNSGVYFVTHQCGDLSDEKIKNNIGLRFAFRSTDIHEIRNMLEFLGVDKDDENNQRRLRELENGECLMRDLYGRVGVLKFHLVFQELVDAFDTRPPVQEEAGNDPQ